MSQHILIIAEKPSVAREIAAVVGANTRKDGYMEGGGYIVSWCFGHLVSLAMPEAYGEKYKRWNVDDLPLPPPGRKWLREVKPDTAAQFNILRGLMNRPDVESLICATDAAREGEHIFRTVYDQAGCTKPFRRLWIASLESSAIREGLENMGAGYEYDDLAAAADCRDKADYTVGINASRIFRSAVGRVQTPTLALVVRREEEIAAFTPSFSYAVRISGGGFSAVSEKFAAQEEAQALCASVTGKIAVITKISETEQTSPAPKLYDLTMLQRDANRLFGLSAKQTLDIAQRLYEKKRLTYPRVDSCYLTDEMEQSTRELVLSLSGHARFPFAAVESADVRRVINSKKVNDHHALLPTPGVAAADLSDLTDDEMLILSMVVCRLFMAVSPPEVSIKMDVEAECGGAIFKNKERIVISGGWKSVFEKWIVDSGKLKVKGENLPDDELSSVHFQLSTLSEGQEFPNMAATVDKTKTSPPAHFTEDLLLAAMERAGNSEYDDPDIEKKGLGTPATMADTIESLVTRGLIERKNKTLLPTQAGKNLIALLPLSLTSPKMTVEWETRLQRMARGEDNPESFMNDVFAFVCTLIAEFDAMTPEQKALIPQPKGRESIGACPRCGQPVREGQKGFFCDSRECGFALWKDNRYFSKLKKRLDRKTVDALLNDGRVFLTGMHSEKSGKTFDAFLVMSVDKDGEKRIDFSLSFENMPKKGKKKMKN